MPLPIGVSVGNVLAVVRLIRPVKKALKDSTGSKAEYQEVVGALKSCEDALRQPEQILVTAEEKQAINDVVQRTKQAVSTFESKLRRYEPALVPGATEKRWRSFGKTIQWQTSGVKEDIQFFQTELQQHTSSLLLMLSTVQTMAGSQAQQYTSKALIRIENLLIAQTAKLEVTRPPSRTSNISSLQPDSENGLQKIQHPIDA